MSELQRVVELANLLVQERINLANLKLDLEDCERTIRRLEQEDIPELMRELGITSFKLQDGSSVDVTEDITCGISEDRRAAAHRWLIDNGFGGLIKTEVVVEFGRGEQQAATDLRNKIGEFTDRQPHVSEKVHPQTLKSFLKEQLAAGSPVPFETFGLNAFNKVKITKKGK